MSLDSLYHATNKRLSGAQDILSTIASNRIHVANETLSEKHREISARVEHILSNCDRLDALVLKEPPARRQNWKIRGDQLKYDVRHLQSQFQTSQVKLYEREQAERDRHELLHTRFTTNAEAAHGDASDTSILIDAALNHQSSLQRSRQGVGELLMQGQETLTALRDQRNLMKNIKKKMLDISSMLGMSNTVMRLIERRSEGDKYLLFGGMIVTCVIMYLVVKFFT